jgi:DNA replication and repair protein RecF
MARRGGSGGFAVAARLDEVDLGTGTSADAPDRRRVRIDGAPASANALSDWLSVLWLTPAMDRLFADAASGRRRFLDRLVLALNPAHATHSARYEAAMRARNKLLAEEGPRDEAWLTALEARMADHGAAIAEARAAAVAALGDRLAGAPEGPFARAGLALEGGEEADLAQALALGRARDAAAGRTLAGPHRTDLVVTHLGKNQPASLCSTGEQKALLIGLILAFADLVAERAGRPPILLLDEIAAHLDPLRRAALFERLGSAGGQVWMTGTEPGLFPGIGRGATWFAVADGAVKSG